MCTNSDCVKVFLYFYVYKMGNPNTCGLHMKPKENFKIGNSIYKYMIECQLWTSKTCEFNFCL